MPFGLSGRNPFRSTPATPRPTIDKTKISAPVDGHAPNLNQSTRKLQPNPPLANASNWAPPSLPTRPANQVPPNQTAGPASNHPNKAKASMGSQPSWIKDLTGDVHKMQVGRHADLKENLDNARSKFGADPSVKNEISMYEADEKLRSFQANGHLDPTKDSPTHFLDGAKARKTVVQNREDIYKNGPKAEKRENKRAYNEARAHVQAYDRMHSQGIKRDQALLAQSIDPSSRTPTYQPLAPNRIPPHMPGRVGFAPVAIDNENNTHALRRSTLAPRNEILVPIKHEEPKPARPLGTAPEPARTRTQVSDLATQPPESYRDLKNHLDGLKGGDRGLRKKEINAAANDNRTSRDLTRAAGDGKLKKKVSAYNEEVRATKEDLKRSKQGLPPRDYRPGPLDAGTSSRPYRPFQPSGLGMPPLSAGSFDDLDLRSHRGPPESLHLGLTPPSSDSGHAPSRPNIPTWAADPNSPFNPPWVKSMQGMSSSIQPESRGPVSANPIPFSGPNPNTPSSHATHSASGLQPSFRTPQRPSTPEEQVIIVPNSSQFNPNNLSSSPHIMPPSPTSTEGSGAS